LGIGGSKALDTVDNGITLSETIHLGRVHPGVSVSTVRIVHWDRTDKEDGLVVERRIRIADEWEAWPREELWFYKRQDAEVLEKEIEMIRQVQLVESKHAEIMAHIWEHYSLLSDAVSPEQFVAGLGLDSNRARSEAKTAKWIEDNGLTWPDGVNVKKINLLCKASAPFEGKTFFRTAWQSWLLLAVDMSYSDLRRALIEKGLKTATMRWYIRITPRFLASPDLTFIRSRNRELVVNKLSSKERLVEINAFRAGIRWDRKTQKLHDGEGREIPFETWKEEADD
jgi:hypothetical protein